MMNVPQLIKKLVDIFNFLRKSGESVHIDFSGNGNTVIINGHKLSEEEKKKVNAILKEESNNKTLPFQVVHRDILKEYNMAKNVLNSKKERDKIKQLKKILQEEDVNCILMSTIISRAFTKSKEDGDKLLEDLERKYSYRGKKIYNLVNGGYLDEVIFPFIDLFKVEYVNNYVEKYRSFFEDIIKFFPLAIFVGNAMSRQSLKSEIKKRLVLDVPFVRIHSIGKLNIKKVEDVTKELKLDERYAVKDRRFLTPAGISAQIYEIKIK